MSKFDVIPGNDPRLLHVRMTALHSITDDVQFKKILSCGSHEWTPKRRLIRLTPKPRDARRPAHVGDIFVFAQCAHCETWCGIPEGFELGPDGWLTHSAP